MTMMLMGLDGCKIDFHVRCNDCATQWHTEHGVEWKGRQHRPSRTQDSNSTRKYIDRGPPPTTAGPLRPIDATAGNCFEAWQWWWG